MKTLLVLAIGLASAYPGVTGSKIHDPKPAPITTSTNALHNSGRQGHSPRGGGAITLDPVSIISLLALGAFLINNILQLLRANQMMNETGKSLELPELNIPLSVHHWRQQLSRTTNAENKVSDMWTFLSKMSSLYFLEGKRGECFRKVLFCSNNSDLQNSRFVKILQWIVTRAERILNPKARGQNYIQTNCKDLDITCIDEILENAESNSEAKIYSILSTFPIRRSTLG